MTRPLGVSILALCNGLVGVVVALPAVVVLVVAATSQAPPPTIIFSFVWAGLGAAVAVSAAGIWRGDKRALLWLIAIFVVTFGFLLMEIVAFFAGAGVSGGELSGDTTILIAGLGLVLLWTIAHLAYFDRQPVRDFFAARRGS